MVSVSPPNPIDAHINAQFDQYVTHDYDRGFSTKGSPTAFLRSLEYVEAVRPTLKEMLFNQPPQSARISFLPIATPATFKSTRETQEYGQKILSKRITRLGETASDPFLNDLAVAFQEPEEINEIDDEDTTKLKTKNIHLHQKTWQTIKNVISSNLSETVQDNVVTAILHSYSQLPNGNSPEKHNFGFTLHQIENLFNDETTGDSSISVWTDLMTINSINYSVGGRLMETNCPNSPEDSNLHSYENALLALLEAMGDRPEEYLSGYDKINLIEQIVRQIENFSVEHEDTLTQLIAEFIKDGKTTDPTVLLSLMELAQTNPQLAEKILKRKQEEEVKLTPEEEMVKDLLEYIETDNDEKFINPETQEIIKRLALVARASSILERTKADTEKKEEESVPETPKTRKKREILRLLQGEIYNYLNGDSQLELSTILGLIDIFSLSTPFLFEENVEEALKTMIAPKSRHFTLPAIFRNKQFGKPVTHPETYSPTILKDCIRTRKELLTEAVKSYIRYIELNFNENSPISDDFIANLNIYMTELVPALMDMNLTPENFYRLVGRVKALSHPLDKNAKSGIQTTKPAEAFAVYDVFLDDPSSTYATRLQQLTSFLSLQTPTTNLKRKDINKMTEQIFNAVHELDTPPTDRKIRENERLRVNRERQLRERIERGYISGIDYLFDQLGQKAPGDIIAHIETVDETAPEEFINKITLGLQRRQSRPETLRQLDELLELTATYYPSSPEMDNLPEEEATKWQNIHQTLQEKDINFDEALDLVSRENISTEEIAKKTGLTEIEANMLRRLYKPYCPGIGKLAPEEAMGWYTIHQALQEKDLTLDQALDLVSNGSNSIEKIANKTGLTEYQANMLIRLYKRIEGAYETVHFEVYKSYIGEKKLREDGSLQKLLHKHVAKSSFKSNAARNFIKQLFAKTKKDYDEDKKGFPQIDRQKRTLTLEIERKQAVVLTLLAGLGFSDETINAAAEYYQNTIKALH